ncbi:Peptidase_S24 domain-containing protein [Vibrio aestuarianus]|nr:Peptidase_S24 domain-containing protein [Vibrio aestuarianus]
MSYEESDQGNKKRNSDPFLEEGKGSIKERLVQLKKGRTNRQLADDWGVPLSTLTGYINRGSMPPVDTAFSIAIKEGVSIEWLVTGETPQEPPILSNKAPVTHEQILEKPKYNVAASAGGGSFIDTEAPVEHYPFTHRFLKRHRLLHADLCVIEARGESMEPTIEDGDELLLKLMHEPSSKPLEGVYVINIDNTLRVKRLEFDIIQDGYRIISDNKLHQEEFIERNGLERMKVIGEVVIVMGKPSKSVFEG